MLLVEYKALLKRLNPVCTRALEAAAVLAMTRRHYEIGLEHLLLKLMDDPLSDVTHVFRALEVSPTPLSRALQRSLEGRRGGNTGKPVFSPLLISWIQDAWLVGSVEAGASRVRSGHLLSVLLQHPESYEAADYAEQLHAVDRDAVRKRLDQLAEGSAERQLGPEGAAAGAGGAAASAGAAGEGKSAGAGPGGGAAEPVPSGDSALARFTTDVTQRAQQGKIDPVLGRDREIRQMIDILGRRQKNNPIIVGEAGVGKTALVEGLALRIAAGDVPAALKNVSIRVLDLGLLQAGAGVRGEFEARLTAVISEVKASPRPIILFIDEAHTIIGAGNQSGGADAANLLKPALARGEMRTIAATTWSEYKKYFEKDAALSRRFQVVKVEEPSQEAAVDMVRGLAARFAKGHGVHVRDDAVVAAVQLSARYISGRLLPDKAVDLLDTCCARVKLGMEARPAELEASERIVESFLRQRGARLLDLQVTGQDADKDEVLRSLDEAMQQASARREELHGRWQAEKKAADAVLAARREHAEQPAGAQQPEGAARLQQTLGDLHGLRGEVPLVPVEVDPQIVAAVVADWTGVPVGKMVRNDVQAVTRLEELLQGRIRGQDAALAAIARRLRNARAGLQDPRQPLGVFLLVGPSGTGKTETAISVADLIFGGERFMVTINMSEFQEKHTVSRLIGSPPGYVGYGEGGVLTEAVRQRPYSVVLMDEVEKADPEVLNLFYQVFDKGMLADGEGRVVDFRNTVIVMTSNLGTDVTMRLAAEGNQQPSSDELGKALRPALTKHFKPALLARMTVVPYFPIARDVLRQIVELKLSHVEARLRASHGVRLHFSERVGEAIGARCQEADTGARNVDHIIREHLLPVLASRVLQHLAAEDMPSGLRVDMGPEGNFQVEGMP